MTEKLESGLTPEEEAYFESGGETALDATATEEAKPEAVEDVAAEATAESEDGPARDEKGRFVPHQALHAEREEHKKTRAEAQELREFKARMEERMRWYEELAKQPEHPPQLKDEPPDPEKDVFAALKYERDRREALEQRLAAEANERAKASEEQRAEAAVWNYWETEARQYSAQNPDFGNAAKWLSEYRDKQLSALSRADPRFSDVKARNAQIEGELKQIVISAAQQRVSPAELIYEIAKGYGYQPSEQPVTGGLPDKIAAIDKAQQASRTVGNGAGKAGGGEMDLAAIMAMPRGEFNAWISDAKNERLFNSLMGA